MTGRRLELYGSRICPYTAELREDLEWRNERFVEYDLDTDLEAVARLRRLRPGAPLAVPVLVEDGVVTAVGWHGRSCMVGTTRSSGPDGP